MYQTIQDHQFTSADIDRDPYIAAGWLDYINAMRRRLINQSYDRWRQLDAQRQRGVILLFPSPDADADTTPAPPPAPKHVPVSPIALLPPAQRRMVTPPGGGPSLSDLMAALGMNRRQFALHVGVAESNLRRWINGACTPSAVTREHIAATLGYAVDGIRWPEWVRIDDQGGAA